MNTKLDKVVKSYIIDHIDLDDYEQYQHISTEKERLEALFSIFKSEQGWNIERVGAVEAYRQWIMGLPTVMSLAYQNYKILELAYMWGSLKESDSKKRKDEILQNWWNFITVKTFQLFRKHGVNVYGQ